MSAQVERAVEIFCLYAFQDEKWVREVEKYLSPLRRSGLLVVRPGSEINAGRERRAVLRQYIERAHIVLLFISPDFLASDECNNFGLHLAMRRYEEGNCRLIPLIIRSTLWQDEPFAELKVLPADAKPLANYSNKDEALLAIARGIQEAVQVITQHPLSAATEAQEQPQPLALLDKSLAAEKTQLEDTSISNSKEGNQVLTVQRVLASWQEIVNYLKRRDLVLAAHLNFFMVLRVEGAADRSTIVLRTDQHVSYKYMQMPDHLMDLELAFMTILEHDCQVRLIGPDIP